MKSPIAHSSATRTALGVLVAAVALSAASGTARACAVCMGSDNPQLVEASNTVLWSLLSLVGFIFVATGCTAWYLVRRARLPLTPEIRAIDCINPPTAHFE